MTDPTQTATALAQHAHVVGKPVLTSWLGGGGVSESIEIPNRAGIPTFEFPDEAARTFCHMAVRGQPEDLERGAIRPEVAAATGSAAQARAAAAARGPAARGVGGTGGKGTGGAGASGPWRQGEAAAQAWAARRGGAGGRERSAGVGGAGARDAGGCICPAIFQPVCGADGMTYANSCEANCAGVTIAHQGACTTGPDASMRGVCNADADCIFQRSDGCCGSCLATTDQPIPPGAVCGVACVIPPGGCSCVNHQCMRGVLTPGAACNAKQDTCGNGLKCCPPCALAPIDGGPQCPPVCTGVQSINGQFICPLIP